jgi:hypothetical protein
VAKKKPQQNRKPVVRGEGGRLLPGGGSLNPGGVPKQALELRRLALKHAPRALKKAIRMLSDSDPKVQDMGITHVLNRALGRPGAPSELPDDAPESQAPEASPQALLSLSLKGLAHVLSVFETRRASGAPMSAEEMATLADTSRTLATLAREERELSKQGVGAGLADAELVAAVLSALPVERLREALREREAA